MCSLGPGLTRCMFWCTPGRYRGGLRMAWPGLWRRCATCEGAWSIGVCGSGPERRAPSAQQIAEYRAWRAGFVLERFVGERGFLSMCLAWADRLVDVSALHVLLVADGHLDLAGAIRLGWQADQLRGRLATIDEDGLGVFTGENQRAPARGMVITRPPATLLAAGDAAVTAGRDGLQLHPATASTRGLSARSAVGGLIRPGSPHEPSAVTSTSATLLAVSC